MLFALRDYLSYRRRSGHYARFSRTGLMGIAFSDRLPPEVVALLSPGDVIAVSTYGHALSWAVMYLTRSDISHVAIFVDSSTVAHATLAGVREDPLESLFGPDVRLLPAHWPEAPSDTRPFLRFLDQARGTPYGWSAVRRKAMRILLGRDRPYFRATFVADLCVLLLLSHALLAFLWSHAAFIWLLLLAYLATVAVNAALWRLLPLPADRTYIKPNELFAQVRGAGALLLFDGEARDIREKK